MSGATILFIDFVSFSKKPTAEQRRLVNSLTSEVIHELRELLNPPINIPNIFAIPTGDGMALAFIHGPNQQWDRTTIFGLILRLQRWAHSQTTNRHSVSLRMGLHVGPVELVTDINGRPNICGETINFAQRVMDSASPRQVLLSDNAFREYIGTESPSYFNPPFSDNLVAQFHGPIEVYAKHGLQILVYKMILSPDQDFWSNDDPDSKHLMLVSLTPLPKEIVGSFSEQIKQAENIAFIQLTGDRFLERFNKGEIELSKDLKLFWVFMPDPETYGHLNLQPPQAAAALVEKCFAEWKILFSKIIVQYPTANLKLGLFKEPPFIGASFIDWARPGGRIHVSPYIWGVEAANCPGYDLQWIGRKPSQIYEIYIAGLEYLHSHTENSAFKQ